MRSIVGLAAAALAIPALAGCTGEVIDTTNIGVDFVEQDIRVENATIVAGDKDSGKAAFLGTVFNTSAGDDEIISITAADLPAALEPSPVVIPAGQNATIQTGREVTADFTDFTANAGSYVPVSIKFKNAGEANLDVLVVAPMGYYATAAPEGTTPVPAQSEGSGLGEDTVESDNLDSAGDEGNTAIQDGQDLQEGFDGAAPEETETDAGALESYNSGQ